MFKQVKIVANTWRSNPLQNKERKGERKKAREGERKRKGKRGRKKKEMKKKYILTSLN